MSFKKKITTDSIVTTLSTYGFEQATTVDGQKKILKEISAENESKVITGHLVSCENNLGRSVIVDLNEPASNNIRQVDHRTIEWIIYKNVKYSQGVRSTIEDLPLKEVKDERNFDTSKIAPGNWFCEISYYRVDDKADSDIPTVCVPQDRENKFGCSKLILEEQFHHSSSFETTEKVTRTELVEKFLGAGNAAMTVSFDKKLDIGYLAEVIGSKNP